MKQQLYIFLTYDIAMIGGTQMYTAGKARYLQNRGWQVIILCDYLSKDHSDIPYLNQYIKPNTKMGFLSGPPYKLRQHELIYCLSFMVQQLNISNPSEYEIFIESHSDAQAYWAELLAEKIGARHFVFCCNETYRPTPQIPNVFFGDNLDFFYFKWQRNELVGTEDTLKKLFNGYKNITASLTEMPWVTREQDAVQDVDFPIEQVDKLDWNICHIGREIKEYVPYVIEGVGKLARRHPYKKIHLIMVGHVNFRLNQIKQTFNDCSNVHVTLLGDLIPIPRILFSKVDVVCAISQSALFAANEDILTICATVIDESKTPGVLGYDTENRINGEGTFSYVEALERVFVRRLYDGRKSTLPKLRPAEEYYDDFFKIIVPNAAPNKEYYTERLSTARIREWTAIFPFGTVARGARVILFGETDMTKDYRLQIESQKNFTVEFGIDYVKHMKPQPYCQVLATVDEHPEEYDDSVVGIERLKTQDYDAIVICLPPGPARDAYNKIIQTVPEAANKVVHAFNLLFT